MNARRATPASKVGAAPRHRRRLTLEQLRVFVAVAEREHVTRAAHDLELAQSAVSAGIAALEGVLAARLFDKVGRNIRLTPAGERLLPRARALVGMADELTADLVEPDSLHGLEPASRHGRL